MVRFLRAGDRVQMRSGGPVMEVVKYATETKLWIGSYTSEELVECVWYDEKGRQKDIFHQKNLVSLNSRPYKKHNPMPDKSPVT